MLVGLALASGACSGERKSSRASQAPPPGQPPPGQQAAPGATPVPGFFPSFGPPPQLPPPEYALGILRQINVLALRALQGQIPCPPEEMAPGVWVTFDCAPAVAPRSALRLTQRAFNGTLPLSVDHRVDRTAGPVRSQGSTGTCTAVSLSTTMDNAVRRMGRADAVSALHVWSRYGTPTMGDAGDGTLNQGMTLEPAWPYDPAKACRMMRRASEGCEAAYGVRGNSVDAALQAEITAANTAARYRITSIEQLQAKPGNPSEVAAVLAAGDAVWAAFDVDRYAWKWSACETGTIPDYVATQDSGHAVALNGYRTENNVKWFLVHNSWGTDWGRDGYAWISERMIQTAMRSAFRIRVADAAVAPPSTPPAQPSPPSTGCAAGQVRDAVYGTCSNACASGSPPAAGVCLPQLPGFGGPPAPPPPGGSTGCPQGQAKDLMTGQCTNLCANGLPAIGGLCLPGS